MFHDSDEILFDFSWPQLGPSPTADVFGVNWEGLGEWLRADAPSPKAQYTVSLTDDQITLRFAMAWPVLDLIYDQDPTQPPFVLAPSSMGTWSYNADNALFTPNAGKGSLNFERTIDIDGGILIVGTIDLSSDTK